MRASPNALLGLARLLGMFSGRPRWLLFVTNHFLFGDESGTHAQAKGTLLAGYIATEPAWRSIERPWRAAHRQARLKTWFHMTDFVTPGHPDYAHLSVAERNRLIQTLVGGILASKKTGFIGAVLRDDYEAVLYPETKKHIRDPYFFSFQLFLHAVLWWANRTLPQGDKIVAVFEEQRGRETRARGIYQTTCQVHDPHGYFYPDCFFIPKRDKGAMIAADILANRAGAFFRRPSLAFARKDDPVLYRLLKSAHVKHHWRYYDQENLREAQRQLIADGYVKLKTSGATA